VSRCYAARQTLYSTILDRFVPDTRKIEMVITLFHST
jgi:hypothetical protein